MRKLISTMNFYSLSTDLRIVDRSDRGSLLYLFYSFRFLVIRRHVTCAFGVCLLIRSSIK